jgi:membrane dipeptidase
MRLTRRGFDIGVRHDVRARGGRVDLPRMKEGGLDAIFFAVYLGQGDRDVEGNKRVVARAFQIFEAIHKAVEANQDVAEIAVNPDDAYRLEAAGKRAIYIGIENGYAIGNDLSLLEKYFDKGARYITLCHSRNNDICDSSTDRNGPEHHGLSDFGRKVVREMNRLGMIVDISHTSDETFYDVIECSKAPIMASHSCARALCDSPRNLNDDMLKALTENGGVIQICILGAYVKPRKPNPARDKAIEELRAEYGNPQDLSQERRSEMFSKWEEITRKYPQSDATVADVVDHIDHVVKLIGIDHVGIGTDFDGGGGLEGCNDVSEMGNITLELVKRGYTEDQIRKIWGGNFMRVFREVQRVAQQSK